MFAGGSVPAGEPHARRITLGQTADERRAAKEKSFSQANDSFAFFVTATRFPA
jgi:hypothetical protein